MTLLLLGALSGAGVAGMTLQLAGLFPNAWLSVLPGQGHVAMLSAQACSPLRPGVFALIR